MTSTVTRRYTFKLYPTPEQAAALHQQRMMCADLWNALLQRNEDLRSRTRGRQRGVVHAEGKSLLSYFDMTNELTQLRHECPEWAALSVYVGHRIAKSLELAYQAFFRRARQGAGAQSGYPRYKRRSDHNSIPHRCASGCRLAPKDGRSWSLYLKGVPGLIHARGILPDEPEQWTDADVIWRDQRWQVSVCVAIERARCGGSAPVTVHLGGIDGLATVNGVTVMPEELQVVALLEADLDRLKSERDSRWQRRAPDDPDWREANERISRLAASIARKRANALHVWSARLIRHAGDLTLIKPRVQEHTASPHGDARQWGAATQTVSNLNRSILSRAPAMAAAMLEYKAAEAARRCDVIIDEAPDMAVGEKLVAASQVVRKMRRAIRRQDEQHQQRAGRARRGDRWRGHGGHGSAQPQG